MRGTAGWLVWLALGLGGCAGADVSKLDADLTALKQRVQTLEGRLKKMEAGGRMAAKAGKAKAGAKAKTKAGGAEGAASPLAGKAKAGDPTAKAAKTKTKAKAPAAAPAVAPAPASP